MEERWEERRKYKRVYVRFPVEYRGEDVWQVTQARDISAGGMFLISDRIEPPQTKVEVMFTFGQEEKRFIHAEGVVVWNRPEPIDDGKGNILPKGMGIMFTKFFPSHSQKFIEDVIKKMENKSAT